jgi:mono/diheme cytochrome c family protein
MQQLFKTVLVAFAFILIFGWLSAAHANQKGSENKGRYYFRGTCKECHTKGAAGGEVTPLNKTMAQWRAYFAKGTHNHGKEPLIKYLPADQLLDASTFLINHAADSPQPETCGK